MAISGKGVERGDKGLQSLENEQFICVVKKLDKHALNMYTPHRAGLGTQELSWIRLDAKELLANGNGKGF
jgi:hypothetical protein